MTPKAKKALGESMLPETSTEPGNTENDTLTEATDDNSFARPSKFQISRFTDANQEDRTNTMSAVLVKRRCPRHGEVIDVMDIHSAVPIPRLFGLKIFRHMVVRVLACSISPGDIQMIKGGTVFMKRRRLPFIPGMNISGVVEQVGIGILGFEVGDSIVASNGITTMGGMAEFVIVNADCAVKKPDGVNDVAAASASSAVTSLHAVKQVKEGDRVLVLGGSGGVGTSALMLAKNAGASLVATTSTQEGLCRTLGADIVINYKLSNWWEIEEFQKNKFDKIIDCVGGGNFEGRAPLVLKPRKEGGRFVAVSSDEPQPSNWLKAICFLAKLPVRPLWTIVTGDRNPGYVPVLPPNGIKGLQTVLKLMDDKKLRIVLDPSSPLPFSGQGTKRAFQIQSGGHAHGKVVVKISSKC